MQNHQFALVTAIAVAATASSAGAQADPAEWATFQHLPAASQQRVAAQIEQDLPASPFLRSLRVCIEDSGKPSSERTKHLAERHGKRVVAESTMDTPMPMTVSYVFGFGTIEQLHTRTESKSESRKKGEDVDRTAEERATSVHQALLGMAPGTDRALAALMHRLDHDPRGDQFAAFLHAWRNGDESFYEALDRTAGTKDSVFFYDAMLGDFTAQFGNGDAAATRALRSSLKAAHDALHDAFLAYRQYRGFREAVAWSLVLPPDRPLPQRLQRYEAAAAGSYSLRQQVVMVCHLFDDDLQRVVDEIVRTAPALGEPIWSSPYDPYPAWNALFATLLPAMIEAATTSDAFLQKAIAQRTEAASTIATTARGLVEEQAKAPTDNGHH